ncbi:TPA: hypothetical protein NG682_002800 [Vibrio parahaemolyticus]|uniref:hypothetical protein n=1 Tax=Vibrio parahaemolyticus TaxID=670 RepID=UPI001122B585|nr:hypothetical protein [Vibrio parahaemolyticus]MDF4940342.1 hypothetical protein [Vibrio parahaemolyticus]TOK37045.1 hypothetical protein CGI20_16815 [Vibrio parahaemolyticus]TOL83141.1 hypothetical protein CGH90_06790 [Vibrio parahaemolyticus]HCE3704072.1 hypothetical protein [Vibrio parahaemolyticus]HCG6653153.1 hypothetical protein [Vibrio parahaemolyticus]
MLNKNIIIGHLDHIFLNLYIDILINYCKCKETDLCIVSLDEDNYTKSLHLGVPVVHYKSIDASDLDVSKSITAISLNKNNAFYLEEVIRKTNSKNKIFIHLTDDEVDRWVKTKDIFGKLKPTKDNHVDKHVLYVINNIKNVIAPECYFKDKLKYLFDNRSFNFIDGRDAFKSLPSKLWEELSNLYDGNSSHTKPENRILLGGKKEVFSLSDVISIINFLIFKSKIDNLKLMVFTDSRRKRYRLWLDFYLSCLRRVKRCKVDISYPTPTNSIAYNAMILSCSHFVLQNRGSLSTARSYISMGVGRVYVMKDSPNDIELTMAEGVDVGRYVDYRELAMKIADNRIDVKKNKAIINSRFKLKYKNLSSIYN